MIKIINWHEEYLTLLYFVVKFNLLIKYKFKIKNLVFL